MDTEYEMSNDPQYEAWSESYKNDVRQTMEPQQEEHLASIKGEFLRAVDEKYRKGQAAHGGDMPLKPGMFKMLWEEQLDAHVYYLTTRAQLRHTYRRLHELVARARYVAKASGGGITPDIINDFEQVAFYLESIVEGEEE